MFEPDKDYTLWFTNAPATQASLLNNIVGVPVTLAFPSNVVFLDLEVRPEHDGRLEKEGVWLTITSVPGGTAIQPSNGSACVAIYDGPKYSIIRLPGATGSSVCALKNTEVMAAMPDVVGYYEDNACLFSWGTNGFAPALLDNPGVPACGFGRDISDGGMVAGGLPGSPKTAAYWSVPGSRALLGSLPSEADAAAFAISANAQYIAGNAVNSSSTPHAVRWDNPSGSWLSPLDLGALNGSSTTPSYGYAVNSAGQVVGASQGGTTNTSVFRAFRTAAGATSIASADELRSFVDTNLNLTLRSNIHIMVSSFTGAATAVNTSGAAVGWSDAAVVTWWDGPDAFGAKQHRAHHWGTDGVPVDLGVLPGGNWSEATAINDAVPVQVVGWSRTSTDTNSVVGFISGGPGTTMVSVQDQHLFYGSTNWHLTRPVDINNWSYILGNGTYEGSPASWLLIPLCPP